MPTASKINKYCTSHSIYTVDFIPAELSTNCKNFLSASYSSQTWRKNSSAMKLLKKFGRDLSIDISLPLNSNTIVKFTEWCRTMKNLKPATIKSYLSSIALAHKLHNLEHTHCLNFVSKQMLKGMEN